MAIKLFGAGLAVNIVAGSARVRRKENGLEEGECTFECRGDPAAAGNVLAGYCPLGSAHPYNGSIWMEQREIIYLDSGAQAVCSYAGVTYEWLDKPSYELILGMEEQPISAHPNFLAIAGKPSAPLHGALFVDPETGAPSTDDASAVFDRFLPYVSGALNPKGGIDSYLDPVVTYRESKVVYSLPSASGFGQIVSDVPGPGFKGSLGRRNWLYVGFTYQRRGDPNGTTGRLMYEVTKEWRLSGRNGCDTDIYGATSG